MYLKEEEITSEQQELEAIYQYFLQLDYGNNTS
jgi:hypothetical protein